MAAAKVRSVVREYVEAALWALVITLFLRAFVIQAFRIPSASMQDTLLIGDFLCAFEGFIAAAAVDAFVVGDHAGGAGALAAGARQAAALGGGRLFVASRGYGSG